MNPVSTKSRGAIRASSGVERAYIIATGLLSSAAYSPELGLEGRIPAKVRGTPWLLPNPGSGFFWAEGDPGSARAISRIDFYEWKRVWWREGNAASQKGVGFFSRGFAFF